MVLGHGFSLVMKPSGHFHVSVNVLVPEGQIATAQRVYVCVNITYFNNPCTLFICVLVCRLFTSL